jgi:hypothetical protein
LLNAGRNHPFCLEDAIILTIHWIALGFNVVDSWPISERRHHQFVRALDVTGIPFHTFTLSQRLEVALSDRGGRRLTDGCAIASASQWIASDFLSQHIEIM